MIRPDLSIIACVAVAACVFLLILAAAERRARRRLENAIITHFLLRRGKSRTREDYALWRAACLPVHCLKCGQLTKNFAECDACGESQPFDDSRGHGEDRTTRA